MAEHPNQILVRRGFDAFSAGDVATLSEIIAEDAIQTMSGDNVVSGEYKGREAILGMYGRLAQETGGTLKVTLESVFANDSTAVAIYNGTGERNGKKLEGRNALVFEIRDGKAVRMTDVPEDIALADDFFA